MMSTIWEENTNKTVSDNTPCAFNDIKVVMVSRMSTTREENTCKSVSDNTPYAFDDILVVMCVVNDQREEHLQIGF